jgi:hypothetical protein
MDQRVSDNRELSRFEVVDGGGWIQKHPEYTDLVPQSYRARFDL